MRRIASIAIAAALIGGLVLQAGPAATVPPGTNGRIAFVSARTGAPEIWTVLPGGGPAKKVTGQPDSVDVDPAWEPPDGARIAFARKGSNDETFNIMLENADGAGDAQLLTSGAPSDRQPAWNPSGTEVAFTRTLRADDTSQVFKVGEGGGTPTQLTAGPAGTYDSSPAWSQDGTQIAFVSDRAGGFPTLWTMDAGGVTESQRTFGPCWDGNPSWSPTGTELVFERFCPGGATGWDLYELNLATGVATVLEGTSDNDHQPAYSPDGLQVVFTRYPAGGGNKDVLVRAADGTGTPTPVADATSPEVDMSPDWGTNLSAPRQSPEDEAVAVTPTAAVRLVRDEKGAQAPHKKKKKKKKRKKKERVIKGVKFVQMRKSRSDVYVLTVDPHLKPRLDVALSNDLLPGHEKTTSMAKRHGAVAAINGDFGSPSGRPAHTFAEDGDLKQLSFAVAPNFAITADEQATYFARPFETVTAREGTDGWQAERWNFGEPGFNDVSVYSGAGGTLEVPPANACAVRLIASSARRWAPNLAGVETDFAVNEVRCAAEPMPLNGGVVLVAQPGSDGAILINSLSPGENVELTWSVGFSNVLDTVGGTPELVDAGVVVATSCSESICNKHPRTGIGVTAAGKILMVVIDGRRQGSKGVTLVKFAQIMRSLGAVEAINLDGGGSSTMVIRGKVRNEPSDGKQRAVSSAVLVLKGLDGAEVIGGPQAKAPRTDAPPPVPSEAGETALLDPASTGGLLEATVEGTFGPPQDLPPALDRALREFRASRQ